jgi:hypothetical protein
MVLAIAAALVVWLVASPARAALAPQCDARGAITFAPPPQLQPPLESIDQGDVGLTCEERLALEGGVEQGNAPIPTTSPEPALGGALPAISPAAAEACPPRAIETIAVPRGRATRIERPPRA